MVRKKVNKKNVLIGIVWTTVVIFILTFYIWNQIESIRLGYAIGDLEKKLQELQKSVDKLEAERAALLSLERVEAIAKKKLKLQPPRKEQIIYDDFIP
ncbi:MAG: cell division protein FtsL [Candidatus Aminicenantales bacterium]